MKTKSTDRIQFELACIRHAYRHRPAEFNHRRSTGLLPHLHPLAFIALYAASGVISLSLIAWFYASL